MKGILFDLDGTLIDSMEVWRKIDVKFVESKGFEYDEESLDEQKSLSISQLPEFFERVYGFETNEEEIRDFMTDVLVDHYKNKFEYKDGVEEKLKELKEKGFKMCITTATISDYCEHAIDRLNLNEYMDFIQTPDKVGVSKSKEEYFIIAAEKLGTELEKTYVFDDALYAIENANSLGMVSVGVYDVTAEIEMDEIKEKSDIFLETFNDLDVDKL